MTSETFWKESLPIPSPGVWSRVHKWTTRVGPRKMAEKSAEIPISLVAASSISAWGRQCRQGHPWLYWWRVEGSQFDLEHRSYTFPTHGPTQSLRRDYAKVHTGKDFWKLGTIFLKLKAVVSLISPFFQLNIWTIQSSQNAKSLQPTKKNKWELKVRNKQSRTSKQARTRDCLRSLSYVILRHMPMQDLCTKQNSPGMNDVSSSSI